MAGSRPLNRRPTTADGRRGARLRRVPAFAVDYVLIAAWAGLLALASFALGAGDGGPVSDPAAKVAGYLVGLVTLTAPMVAASALFESRRGGTPGKRLLGLRVQARDGSALTLAPALARNAVKYVPWELAHVGIWTMPGTPFLSPAAWWNMALWVLALSLVGVQAGLILATGRGLHDRLVASRVVHDRDAPAAEAGPVRPG